LIARSQDDHVKNIALLMDKSGTCVLSRAFDVTYSQLEGRSQTRRAEGEFLPESVPCIHNRLAFLLFAY
jgi:hypothetical protein